MRYLILVVLAASVICVTGCGGGGGTPAGYNVTDGWVTTPDGLKYKYVKIGTGYAAADGQSLTVNYTGWLDDGTVFDSSLNEGREPLTFTLGRGDVIKGFDEGLKGARQGDVIDLIIPYSLGYGDQVHGPIPAYSTLHFEVEVLSIY